MNINPMQLLAMLKNGSNPQQLMTSILKQQSQDNPILNNAMNLANSGNAQGLEQLARNLAKQRGIDFDEAFNAFKNQFL